jgi:hypothetical protein
MVPATTHTNFHHITGIFTLLAVERRELRGLGDAAAIGGKPATKNVGNVDKFLFFTYWAIKLSKFTDVFRSPQQFGVGIANIDAT